MTIIQPKHHKFKINLLLAGLILAMLAMAYWSISMYTQTVDLRHLLRSQEEELQKVKVANAEIKNELYSLTDYKNLTSMSEERGLVRINSTDYVEIDVNSWSAVSVSQF